MEITVFICLNPQSLRKLHKSLAKIGDHDFYVHVKERIFVFSRTKN